MECLSLHWYKELTGAWMEDVERTGALYLILLRLVPVCAPSHGTLLVHGDDAGVQDAVSPPRSSWPLWLDGAVTWQ